MKILFVIEDFIDGGASDALVNLAAGLSNSYKNVVEIAGVFCKNNSRHQGVEYIEVFVGVEKELLELVLFKQVDIVHWFRTNKSSLLEKFISIEKTSQVIIPYKLIVTLCQYPSEYHLHLTPKEYKRFDHLVLISRHAYKHRDWRNVLNDEKSLIYFGSYNEALFKNALAEKKNPDKIIIGRGSTLNKFNLRTLNIFASLNEKYPGKLEFQVIGSGSPMIRNQIIKGARELCLDNFLLIDQLTLKEWLSKVHDFTIYAYYLPKKAYSAIDVTIQHAMAAAVPVVYLGPPGPAELLENGVSGFISESEQDFERQIVDLIENISLRQRIGLSGKVHLALNFNTQKTFANYFSLYKGASFITTYHRRVPTELYFYAYFSLFQKTRLFEFFKYRIRRLWT